jgi:hypothetical protein
MPGAPKTRARYEKVLAAARECGPNAAAIARMAGCDRGTARRLLERGWPGVPWGRPISVVLREEGDAAKVAAAARLKAEADAAQALAARTRDDAIKSQSEELVLRAGARRAAGDLLQALLARRDLLSTFLDRLAGDAKTMSTGDAIKTVRQLRGMIGEAMDLARSATEIGQEVRAEQGTRGAAAPDAPEVFSESVVDEAQQNFQVMCRFFESRVIGDITFDPSDSFCERVHALARTLRDPDAARAARFAPTADIAPAPEPQPWRPLAPGLLLGPVPAPPPAAVVRAAQEALDAQDGPPPGDDDGGAQATVIGGEDDGYRAWLGRLPFRH